MTEWDEESRAAREKGIYYLQFSDKTEEEMKQKLAEQGFSPASVANAVEYLKSRRYLDDESYVRRYLEKKGKKKSEKQLVYELRQKGIGRELIDRALEENPVEEEEQILRLLEKKKYGGAAAAREEKQRISAFLARKGFSYEAIQKGVSRFEERGEEREEG